MCSRALECCVWGSIYKCPISGEGPISAHLSSPNCLLLSPTFALLEKQSNQQKSMQLIGLDHLCREERLSIGILLQQPFSTQKGLQEAGEGFCTWVCSDRARDNKRRQV